MQELWFLRSARRLMLTDIYMKFREDGKELWFLCSACRLMLIDIYMKFCENSLNDFQVIEWTRV